MRGTSHEPPLNIQHRRRTGRNLAACPRGMDIDATLLDAVIDEAARRGCHRISLWTHEHQNERVLRLYRSRSFART